MIEQVRKFKTNDGSLFDTIESAERYEKNRELFELLLSNTQSHLGGDFDADDLESYLRSNGDLIAEYLKTTGG